MRRLRVGWLDAMTGDRETLRAALERALAGGTALTVGFVNPHVYTVGGREARVREHLAGADLVCVDGVGIALAQRLAGRGAVPRVVAEQLFRAFWERSRAPVAAVLIGVEPGVVERAAVAMNAAGVGVRDVDPARATTAGHGGAGTDGAGTDGTGTAAPGAAKAGPRIVATLDGFADDATLGRFLVRQRRARLVLIGAGSPRSEAIALAARAALPEAVVFHCGAGTIKTWAGTKRRAPAWTSRAGLEWLHRLLFEPHTRSRYLAGIPRFLAALARPRPRMFVKGRPEAPR